MSEKPAGTLLISADDVRAVINIPDCVDAVENAFKLYAEGKTLKTGLLHIDAAEGEFHIKAGGLNGSAPRFGAKINGGFFRNRDRYDMPNIQGMIVLSDADNGFPLAVMDSVEITRMRTGAATAVAAKYLARPDSQTVTVCGYGTQARVQLLALGQVLPLKQVFVWGRDLQRANAFAKQMSDEMNVMMASVSALDFAASNSDVVVTCTPSGKPFLMKDHIRPGTFVAAVGADSPDKQELDPYLIAAAKVVPDILEQCERVGELHRAIGKGLMARDDIFAELADVVAGTSNGHRNGDDIVVFDSTGTALQDVAAAAVVYDRVKAAGRGVVFSLNGN